MSLFKTTLTAFFIILLGPLCRAQSGSGYHIYDWGKRTEAREQKRWTLEDWLEQRDRNRMMDLWLSMHSPSPYELMLGGAYNSGTVDIDTPSSSHSFTSLSGEFAAYAQIFGLSLEYENNTHEKYNDLAGLFNLRIFGDSIQSSYLTLSYGLRTRSYGPGADLNTSASVQRASQQFAQGSLQLYLRKYFGIDGFYRFYLPASQDSLGDLKADEIEGGAFIDFGALRIFGRWFQETNRTTAPGSANETKLQRSGIKSGIKIFF